jgi:hypothetical protein
MGVSSEELLQFDAPPTKEGICRVPAAFRAALRRNEIAARRMRSTESHPYEVLTIDEIKQLRSMSTTMLNVDLAFLHAAAHLAESPALIDGCVVPPMTLHWRSVPTMCRTAIFACNMIYDAYRPAEKTPVSSLFFHQKFLSKCRDRASTFF